MHTPLTVRSVAPDDLPSDATMSYGRRTVGDAGLAVTAARFDADPDSAAEEMTAMPAPAAGGGDTPTPNGAAARYRLVRVVGRGGMGEVWEAEQQALRRRVAVKRLVAPEGSGPADREGLQRAFRLEAMVSGRLSHPNIVPVHDLGEDEFGNPLMAMKLVRGRPWSDLLKEDFEALKPSELLAKNLPILAQMAQAVAFAHSQGIVHRDLKPAQVMVGEFGEVLLADWGLAVQMDGRIDSRTSRASRDDIRDDLPLASNASNPSGTPALMAPEQTLPSPDFIGPWTDVFLMGGTLYFLLTGTYPFRGRTSMDTFFAAQECRFEPPAERAPERFIPAELSALCLDAMRRVPEERIASAKEFLARLEAYLFGANRQRESEELAAALEEKFAALERDPGKAPEPMYAAYEALGEQLARALELWPPNAAARRLQARVLAARAAQEIRFGDLLQARVHLQSLGSPELAPFAPPAGELAAALSAAEAQRERARRQRTALMAAAAGLFLCVVAAGGWAFQQQGIAKTQRGVAMTRAKSTADLQRFLLTDLGDSLDPNVPRDGALIGKIAAKIMDHYAQLDLRGSSPELMVEIVDDMADTADAMRRFARYRDALSLIEQAEGLARDPIGNEELLSKCLIYKGAILGDLGELQRCVDATGEALAIRRRIDPPDSSPILKARLNIAAARVQIGDLPEARAELEALLPLLLAMEKGEGEQTLLLYGHLATCLRELGLFADADAYYLKAVRTAAALFGTGDSKYAAQLHKRGIFLTQVGRPEEALGLLEEGLAIDLAKVGPDHPSVGVFHEAIGAVQNSLGRYDEAKRETAEGLRIAEATFGAGHARPVKLRADLAKIQWVVGEREQAVAELQKLALAYPDTPGARSDITMEILESLVFMHARLGRLGAADEVLAELLPMLRAAFGDRHPRVGSALSVLAAIQESRGELGDAGESYREALDIQAAALGEGHGSAIRSLSDLGLFLQRRGRLAEAHEMLLRAAELRIAALGAGHPEVLPELSNLGNVQMALGRHADARESYAEGLPIALALAEGNGAAYNRLVAMTMASSLARACLELGDWEGAVDSARIAVDMMLPLNEAAPADTTTAMQTSSAIHDLATSLRKAGSDEAAAWYERNLAVVAGPGEPGPEAMALHIRKGLALFWLGRTAEAEPIIRYWKAERKKSNPEIDEVAAALGIE